MAALQEKSETIMSTTTGVDMKTAASTAIYIVPYGKVLRITGLIVRDNSASLAGGTSYSVTNWRQTFSLAGQTTANTGYTHVYGADLAQYTEIAAGTTVNFTITTGSTAAATATIDLLGILS